MEEELTLSQMAIWSLTKERVDKLLKQIGEKEHQINELLKLSKEDLWERDLDDFMKEWDSSLKEAADARKKIKNMKRRASGKLGGIAGMKPKKRKGVDSDDSDFETSKPKKAKKATDVNMMSKFLDKAKANAPKPKAPKKIVNVDGSSDIEAAVEAAKPKTVPTKPPAVIRPETILSSDVEEIPVPARAGRKVARKPVKYGLTDSEDEDDDFDIGKMVKGIGGSTTVSNGPQLFTAASRPPSSNGTARKTPSAPRGSTAAFDVSFDADETNYHGLVPSKSPTKTVIPAGLESDDELGYTIDIDAQIPAGTKAAPRALQTTAARSVPAPKSSSKSLSIPKKSIGRDSKSNGRQMSTTTASSKTSKKPIIFSSDDGEEEGGGEKAPNTAENLANDMLSDDDEDEDDDIIIPTKSNPKPKSSKTAKPKATATTKAKAKPSPKPKPKAKPKAKAKAIVTEDENEDEDDDDDDEVIKAVSSRPARRAAAQTKKSWVVEDDSEVMSEVMGGDDDEGEGESDGSDD